MPIILIHSNVYSQMPGSEDARSKGLGFRLWLVLGFIGLSEWLEQIDQGSEFAGLCADPHAACSWRRLLDVPQPRAGGKVVSSAPQILV